MPNRRSTAERWTSSRLRRAAEDAGYSTTDEQFGRFARRHLLPPPDRDGYWEPWVAEALIEVRKLSVKRMTLPRRVVCLRSNAILFPIRGEHVQEAMLDVLPTIEAAVRKLKRVVAATKMDVRTLDQGRLPYREEWRGLLRSREFRPFEDWLTTWYLMVGTLVPAWSLPDPDPLADIPVEERVILYGVLDMSRRRAERARALNQAGARGTSPEA